MPGQSLEPLVGVSEGAEQMAQRNFAVFARKQASQRRVFRSVNGYLNLPKDPVRRAVRQSTSEVRFLSCFYCAPGRVNSLQLK